MQLQKGKENENLYKESIQDKSKATGDQTGAERPGSARPAPSPHPPPGGKPGSIFPKEEQDLEWKETY